MAAYTTIDNPELYFQTKIYTGDGNTGRSITFDNTDTSMQPDLAWFKNRDDTDHFGLVDSVRGVTKRLSSNDTFAEQTDANNISAFNSNGFSISASGIDNMTNTSGEKYVFWCWKESATAGFDIVGYTGNATARTISHSLSAVPKVILGKRRSDASNWCMYHASHGNTKALYLNDTTTGATSTTFWNDTNPTSSVFTVGTDAALNGNTDTQIAYLWSEKQGFSKFGSYIGNGASSGSYIHLGFRPAWFLVKRSDSSNSWHLVDAKRNTFNPTENGLFPDTADAENTGNQFDFLANGVKLNSSDGGYNASGGTYIYMAFAEAPFVNSKGVPANAR